jgi:hypothetical protein
VGGIFRGLAISGIAISAKAAEPGVDWGQVLITAGIWAGIVGGAAAVIAVVPMFRHAAQDAWDAAMLRAGIRYRQYSRKFVRSWGIYKNPYLNKDESLDLRSTYVPLLVRGRDGLRETGLARRVRQASEVMAELPVRMVIIGDPGSGKSTLLAAQGVSMVRGSGPPAPGRQVVPYLVQLRDLATFVPANKERVSGQNIVADYITDEILVKGGFFKSIARAREFFRRSLDEEKAVVMLDGFDEVAGDKLDAVMGAIDDFMHDGNADRPTGKAKIWLTCRTQNFAVIRGRWIDGRFAPYDLYSLEPLSDTDIVNYLNKFGYTQKFSYMKRAPRTFATAEGPGQFMAAIRQDDKIDLLRAPLILAMAVGLYADRPGDIPSSIGTLYQEMITEMLNRHLFLNDRPGPRPVIYKTTDKYSFLQQFALHAARTTGTFGDFTKDQVVAYCDELKDTLDVQGKPEAFVDEIIFHSSLLSDVHHSGLFHFAHRSIQEFLSARELRTQPDEGFLLGQATDLNWRQVIQFYTAGREARQVDEFLLQLATVNAVLAVRCLQAAKSSGQAARAVLSAMRLESSDSIGALAAATHSPQPFVQEQAIERLDDAVMAPDGPFAAANMGVDEMLPLLRFLASAHQAKIVEKMAGVVRELPDDARLVGPIWQCLRADGIQHPEHAQACSEIVDRLLQFATDPVAFKELAAQDPGDRQFLAGLRQRAYPFRRALPPEHNLVTLLAWAEYRGVLPAELNRFFAAKAAGELDQVESARRRTVKFSLCWPARAVSVALLLTAAGFAGFGLVKHPGQALHPFGWWTLLLIFGTGIVPYLIFILHDNKFRASGNQWWETGNLSSGNFVLAILNGTVMDLLEAGPGLGFLITIAIGSAFALAPVFLAGGSLVAHIALPIGGQLLFWELDMSLFDRERSFYLYRPNPFVDMYEDARSALWVSKPKGD